VASADDWMLPKRAGCYGLCSGRRSSAPVRRERRWKRLANGRSLVGRKARRVARMHGRTSSVRAGGNRQPTREQQALVLPGQQAIQPGKLTSERRCAVDRELEVGATLSRRGLHSCATTALFGRLAGITFGLPRWRQAGLVLAIVDRWSLAGTFRCVGGRAVVSAAQQEAELGRSNRQRSRARR
jgi:hypothetical protein